MGALLCLAAPLRAAPPEVVQPADAPEVALEIEQPLDGAVVGPGGCGLLVAGRAGAPLLDLVIVLDVSVSTAAPSGADVDGDGEVGRAVLGQIGATVGEFSSDPDDSILAAEVAAARLLVARLDLRRTRVALVTFSGGYADLARADTRVPDATTRVPLTDDRAALDADLATLVREVPAGGTHMGAGVDRATVELLGLSGARSQADPRRARAAVLLTDGSPTLPHGPGHPADNTRAALAAADRAHKARVRVTTVAVGPEALAGPVAAVEIAQRTGGRFLAVRDLGHLADALGELELLQGLEVRLRNATSGEPASRFELTPDGSFGGFVPLAEGENRIEAVAHAEAGGEATRAVRVALDPAAAPPAVPREYDFFAGDAFGACLRQARRIDLSAEDLRREALRRQLRLELERERARALERAAQQRRELELAPEAPAP